MYALKTGEVPTITNENVTLWIPRITCSNLQNELTRELLLANAGIMHYNVLYNSGMQFPIAAGASSFSFNSVLARKPRALAFHLVPASAASPTVSYAPWETPVASSVILNSLQVQIGNNYYPPLAPCSRLNKDGGGGTALVDVSIFHSLCQQYAETDTAVQPWISTEVLVDNPTLQMFWINTSDDQQAALIDHSSPFAASGNMNINMSFSQAAAAAMTLWVTAFYTGEFQISSDGRVKSYA
jgi:hypothetical protein